MHRLHHHSQDIKNGSHLLKHSKYKPRCSADILSELNAKELDVETASRLFENTDVRGVLWAGELAIEQGLHSNDPDVTAEHYTRAGELFHRADVLSHLTGRSQHIQTRARILTSYIQVLSGVSFTGHLPSEERANSVYQSTLRAGGDLVSAYRAAPIEDHHYRQEMMGTIAETAVLALLNRFAINEIGGETYFPVLSTLTDDRKNKLGSIVNHGWDVGIYTQYEGEDPSLNYRLQVKWSKRNPKLLEGTPYIGNVCLQSDLGLKPGEPEVACSIIDECLAEQVTDRTSFPAHLDLRADKLLELIG